MTQRPTPRYRFVGGPLAGTEIEKTSPGRTPLGFDGSGKQMSTDNFYRQSTKSAQPALYSFASTEWNKGMKVYIYAWQGVSK